MFALQSKIVRVLNLWQKNSVFKSDIIQPLLDMAAGLPPPSVTPVSASSAVPVNSTTPGKLYTACYTVMHPLLCENVWLWQQVLHSCGLGHLRAHARNRKTVPALKNAKSQCP